MCFLNPNIGQAVLPGDEVPAEEQLAGSNDEGHAQTWLCRLHTHTAG